MCIYILKIVNMVKESEINRQIRNHVIFTYAKEALKICQQFNIDRCIDCSNNNASWRHHDLVDNRFSPSNLTKFHIVILSISATRMCLTGV